MCALYRTVVARAFRYAAISAFTSAAIAIERERGKKSFQNHRLSVKYGLHEKREIIWQHFRAREPVALSCTLNLHSTRACSPRAVTRIKFHGYRVGAVSRQIFI